MSQQKPFTVANVRKLDMQFNAGEISYSGMVEIMNEMADEYAKEAFEAGRELGDDCWNEKVQPEDIYKYKTFENWRDKK